MPLLILPLEIEERILNHLAKIEEYKGHATLKKCSLVCQAFLPICRKHIFRNITLHNWEDYIRDLDYSIRVEDLTSPSIQESLKRISKLKFLLIWNHYELEFNWDNNPIRSALLHLLHLPTITHFKMSLIDNFVVSDLTPCVNLKYLDIGVNTTVADENTFPAALPENPIQLDEFESGTGTSALIMKLCSSRRPDGLPIVDFRSLSKLRVNPEEPNEGEASWELLGRCHGLTDVHISFSDPRNIRPSLTNMLRPFMQTLKHLVLDIGVDGVDVDPLFGIPSELAEMHTKNVIKTIDIQVIIPADGNCRRGDDWRRLDRALTAPGWFSLDEVKLTIAINIYDRINDDDELQVALQKLPETQFPCLSSGSLGNPDLAI